MRMEWRLIIGDDFYNQYHPDGITYQRNNNLRNVVIIKKHILRLYVTVDKNIEKKAWTKRTILINSISSR